MIRGVCVEGKWGEGAGGGKGARREGAADGEKVLTQEAGRGCLWWRRA